MIELIPAIDIIDGQCVRLTKGDYDQKTVYSDSPASMAKEFEALGFKRLHVVDLDGAKSKHIVNDAVMRAITTQTSLKVDFGGGIKTDEDIEKAFASGAAMVTIGSVAVTQPDREKGRGGHQYEHQRNADDRSDVGADQPPVYDIFSLVCHFQDRVTKIIKKFYYLCIEFALKRL